MDGLAALAEGFGFGELRVTQRQNLVLPDVPTAALHELWLSLRSLALAAANGELLSDIIACPGLDFCYLANARSIPIAQRISERFRDLERQRDVGKISLNISGCINACAHHHVANIGILGVDKKGEEFYQLTLGGAAAEDAAIGAIVGPAFSGAAIVDAVETVIEVYLARRNRGEVFIDTYRRIGAQPFKEKLYAAA